MLYLHFFLLPLKYSFCFSALDVWSPTGMQSPYPGAILLKKLTLPPSRNKFLQPGLGGTWCPYPPLVCNMLACAYKVLVRAVTITMSSYVCLRDWSRRDCFCAVSYHLSLLLFASSSPVILKRWKEGGVIWIFLLTWASHSLLFSACWRVVCLSFNHHQLQMETSPMRIER